MTKREQIAADYLGGMSLAEVADKYGYANRNSLGVVLHRWGIKLPKEEASRRHSEAAKKRWSASC